MFHSTGALTVPMFLKEKTIKQMAPKLTRTITLNLLQHLPNSVLISARPHNFLFLPFLLFPHRPSGVGTILGEVCVGAVFGEASAGATLGEACATDSNFGEATGVTFGEATG